MAKKPYQREKIKIEEPESAPVKETSKKSVLTKLSDWLVVIAGIIEQYEKTKQEKKRKL